MPLARMRSAAADAADLSRQMGELPLLAEDDALVQEMLAWFKTEFFSWVGGRAVICFGSGDCCSDACCGCTRLRC